jgi:hypothetical protein
VRTPGGIGHRRGRAAALALLVACLALPGCSEVEESSPEGYEPVKLGPVGPGDIKPVSFTAEGARRVGLRTARVTRSGRYLVVPYAALIYDGVGKTYVYTTPRPLALLRRAVAVSRIEGGRVLLADGPPAGTRVVTAGAAEAYGSELEIAGGH